MKNFNDINNNVMVLANALKAAGAISATLSYSGSGDSGDSFETEVEWADNHELLVTSTNEALGDITYTAIQMFYNGKSFEHKTSTTTSNFESALEAVCFQAVDATGHSGWENNEGGSGAFTVYASGYARLEHTDNVTESEGTETELDEASPQWNNIQAVAKVLTQAGASSAVITYYGGGDSGDINDVAVNWPEGVTEVPIPNVTYTQETVNHVNGQRVTSEKVVTAKLESALGHIIWEVIDDAGHSGFENNDGGEGSLVIEATGKAWLDHTDFSEGEGDADVSYFGDNVPEEDVDD